MRLIPLTQVRLYVSGIVQLPSARMAVELGGQVSVHRLGWATVGSQFQKTRSSHGLEAGTNPFKPRTSRTYPNPGGRAAVVTMTSAGGDERIGHPPAAVIR
jgi:hypothetical protein